MKGLYNKRNSDNTTNAIVLGIFLVIFNIHSIIIWLEYFTNLSIGLLEFWMPNTSTKVGLGYAGGFAVAIAYLLVVYFIKKTTSRKDRFIVMRMIVTRGRKKSACILYTIFSIILFLGTIYLLMITSVSYEMGK